MSEQALGGTPLGFGIVVEEIKPSELSCLDHNIVCNIYREKEREGCVWGKILLCIFTGARPRGFCRLLDTYIRLLYNVM